MITWNISNKGNMKVFWNRRNWNISNQREHRIFQSIPWIFWNKVALNTLKQRVPWIFRKKRVPGIFHNGYLEYFETNGTFKKGYLEHFEKRVPWIFRNKGYLEYFETKGTLNILKQLLPGIFRPILCSSSPPSSSGSLCTPSLCPQIFPQESKSPEAICVGLDADAEKYQQLRKSIRSFETAEKWVKTLGKNQVLLFWARWSTLGFPARRQRLDGGLYSTRTSKQRPPHLNRRQPAKVFRKL